MSIKAMTWAFDQLMSGNDKVILLALADHADENGICWPSINRIAERSCVSRRTVINILAKLETSGFLTKDVGGGRKSNRYAINMRGAEVAPVQTAAPQQCNGLHPSSAIAVAPEPSITTKEPKHMSLFEVQGDEKAPSQDQLLEDEFEEWWCDQYPARRGTNPKQPAKKSYIKARQTVTKETIWAGTERYFDELSEMDRVKTEYVAMAVTFLNQQRWEQ